QGTELVIERRLTVELLRRVLWDERIDLVQRGRRGAVRIFDVVPTERHLTPAAAKQNLSLKATGGRELARRCRRVLHVVERLPTELEETVQRDGVPVL